VFKNQVNAPQRTQLSWLVFASSQNLFSNFVNLSPSERGLQDSTESLSCLAGEHCTASPKGSLSAHHQSDNAVSPAHEAHVATHRLTRKANKWSLLAPHPLTPKMGTPQCMLGPTPWGLLRDHTATEPHNRSQRLTGIVSLLHGPSWDCSQYTS